MTVRIGVFICHCGHNIASTVDVEDVVEYAKRLPGVVYSGRNLYSCSQEGLTSIKESIKNNELDRVVVAACTPRTHEPVFRRACEQVGINKYLFEFVNIREHCSWIHTKEKEEATKKAKTQRQSPTMSTPVPIEGATIGTSRKTAMMYESTLAIWSPR